MTHRRLSLVQRGVRLCREALEGVHAPWGGWDAPSGVTPVITCSSRIRRPPNQFWVWGWLDGFRWSLGGEIIHIKHHCFCGDPPWAPWVFPGVFGGLHLTIHTSRCQICEDVRCCKICPPGDSSIYQLCLLDTLAESTLSFRHRSCVCLMCICKPQNLRTSKDHKTSKDIAGPRSY